MTSEPIAEAVCENCEGTKIVFRSVPRGPCPECKPREEPERESETIEKVRLGLRSTPPLQEIAVADAVAAALRPALRKHQYAAEQLGRWRANRMRIREEEKAFKERTIKLHRHIEEAAEEVIAAAQAEAPRVAELEAALVRELRRERDELWQAVTFYEQELATHMGEARRLSTRVIKTVEAAEARRSRTVHTIERAEDALAPSAEEGGPDVS